MKKLFFLLSLCFVLPQSFQAQLKVSNNGNVGIQLGAETPLSGLSIGGAGDSNAKTYITGNTLGLKIRRTGTCGLMNRLGIDSYTDLSCSSPTWNFGIRAKSYSPSYIPYSRAFGVFGLAGNANSGYNYGVFGQLAGSYYGSAIVGYVSSSVSDYTDLNITGSWAGYFQGNMKVTGYINGVTVGNSDKRFKKNIVNIDSKSTIEKLLALEPVEYNLKQKYVKAHNDSLEIDMPIYDEDSQLFTKKHFGLIAQDLQKLYPDLVYEDTEGYLSINYTGIIPLLIASIKELNDEINILKGKVSSSQQKVNSGIQSENLNSSIIALLEQNKPNPFSEETITNYILPGNISIANLIIYDMNGKELKEIEISDRRNGSLTIKGSEFSAGMYLYALIADGNLIDTKRMILTK